MDQSIGIENRELFKAAFPDTNTPSQNCSSNIPPGLFQQTVTAKFENNNSPSSSLKLGNITVLIGTSTAGKSSIIDALRKINPDIVEKGSDISAREALVSYAKANTDPEDYKFLEESLVPRKEDIHIDQALHGDYNFKEGISVQDQEKAKQIANTAKELCNKYFSTPGMSENVNQVMLDEIVGLSLCGKSSVFDVVEIDHIGQKILIKDFEKTVNVKLAVVYCPLNVLIDRMLKRTENARANKDFHEVRASPGPLFQFAKIFGPKDKEDSTTQVIDILTRQQAEIAFDKAWCMMNLEDNPENISRQAKEKSELLEKLGFTDNVETIELVSRFKNFDFLIDTSKEDPAQVAKKLI